MQNLDSLIQEALGVFASVDGMADLEQAKARYLGKGGSLTELLKGLGKMEPEARREAGARINQVKERLEDALRERREAIRRKELERQLAQESLDVTLPGRGAGVGGLHPVTLSLERIERLFASIGFSVVEGPEIEDDFHNFTALNTPQDHPARSMHDTFTWKAATCCAPTPARCRCVPCRPTSPATATSSVFPSCG